MQNQNNSFDIIAELLKQKIGLDACSIGTNSIKSAVSLRMKDSGLSDITFYLAQLQTSERELAELIELIVVPETWFFRDRQPFVFLAHYVISEWLAAHPDQKLRVLSVPCATGEEPYSIAIALLETGLKSDKFQIDALDISKNALIKAKQAIYNNNSFRGSGLILPYPTAAPNAITLRERYFEPLERGYRVKKSITQTINFMQANLLESSLLLGKNYYDIIFCRNLLIYLDMPAREKAMQVLDRLLVEKGLLFLGHSEMGKLPTSHFIPVRQPFTFAAQKTEVKADIKKPKKPKNKSLSVPNSKITQQAKEITVKAKTDNNKTSLLETAKNLADQGQLEEAIKLCREYLHQNRTNAEVYVLLGELYQAGRQEESAEQYFHKAIYLQANHEEALMHLALIKEQRGDFTGAQIIRQRIQRLNKSETL